MDLYELGTSIFGRSRAEDENILTDATTRTYIGTAASDSTDGSVLVELSEDVTMPDDYDGENGISVELPTTAAVSDGDEVVVTVFGGGAMKSPVVTGVVGSGDRTFALAEAAKAAADAVEGIAQSAKDVADAVSQHFWHADDGAHVTEVTQDEWNDEGGEKYHSGPNSLWNSLGMLFRNGLRNLLAILTNGIAIYDGEGNEADNIIASFTSEGQVFGYTNDVHATVTARGLDVMDEDGVSVAKIGVVSATDPTPESRIGAPDGVKTVIGAGQFRIVDPNNVVITNIRSSNVNNGLAYVYMSGTGDGVRTSFTSGNTVDATTGVRSCYYEDDPSVQMEYPSIDGNTFVFATPPDAGRTFRIYYATPDTVFSITLGTRNNSTPGAGSIAIGRINAATASPSYTVGYNNSATAPFAAVFGASNKASARYSTMLGSSNTATSSYTSAMGNNNQISGERASATGNNNEVSGEFASATGNNNELSGYASNALGLYNTATGDYATAIGYELVASGNIQTVIGRFNEDEPDKTFIIGNGSSDTARSNVLTVDRLGNIRCGKTRIGSTNWDVIEYKDDTIDSVSSTNNITSPENRYFSCKDKNGRYYAYVNGWASNNGTTQVGFTARKYVNNANVDNYLRLNVTATGARTVQVADAAPWLSALGLAVTTGTVTTGAGASSIGSSSLKKQGNIVTLTLFDVKLSAALASGSTSGVVATIPTGYRPPATTRVAAAVNATGNYGNTWAVVGTSGNVQIANRSQTQIAASTTTSFTVTYIVN